MPLARLILLAIAPVGIATLAVAQRPLAAPASEARGYVARGAIDLIHVLPPAPRKGELRYDTDRRVFRAMRRRIGTPRWHYATADVRYDTPTMMKDFSCAAGMALDERVTPATYRLLAMTSADTGLANNAAKDYWQRLRPFHIDTGRTREPPAFQADLVALRAELATARTRGGARDAAQRAADEAVLAPSVLEGLAK